MDLNKFSSIIRNNNINESEKFKAFYEFYDYYSKLVERVLRNKIFTERQLSVDIFREKWTEKQSKNVFKKQLFSSFKTLDRIKTGIETGIINRFNIGADSSSIDNFSDFLLIFSFDVFELVKYAELKYNNVTLNYDMGSAIGSSSRDIFENASIMLHIKHFGINSIHYRDFFSYTVFAIRLMIEIAGKKILGFNSITDEKGDRVKNIKTQIAWDFIKHDQLTNKRIKLPLEVDTVLEVEKWTNRFIHTGYIQPIFLVENGLFFIRELSIPKSTKISEYNSLKLEFEEFIQKKVKGKQSIRVNWEDGNCIESEIISR